MATLVRARELRVGDVISFGGRRARVDSLRHDGALVVVLLREVGAFLTYARDHEIALVSRVSKRTHSKEGSAARSAGCEGAKSANGPGAAISDGGGAE